MNFTVFCLKCQENPKRKLFEGAQLTEFYKIPLRGIGFSMGIVAKSQLTFFAFESKIMLIHYAPVRLARIG